MNSFFQLALPLPIPLQLQFPSSPVAFAEVPALLAAVLQVVVSWRLAALFSGFDVLLEGDDRPVTAIGPRALRLSRRQHRLQARMHSVVGGLLAIGRLLQHGRLLLLRLLDGLLRNVCDEEEEAVLTHCALDQPAERTQLKSLTTTLTLGVLVMVVAVLGVLVTVVVVAVRVLVTLAVLVMVAAAVQVAPAACEHSLRLVVGHPLAQTDESLVSGVDRQAVPVHQDALMAFSEVQGPETAAAIRRWTGSHSNFVPLLSVCVCAVPEGGSQRQKTLQLKLLREGGH